MAKRPSPKLDDSKISAWTILSFGDSNHNSPIKKQMTYFISDPNLSVSLKKD